MSLDKPVIQPSEQNRGPVLTDGTNRMPSGFLLLAPGSLTFQLHRP